MALGFVAAGELGDPAGEDGEGAEIAAGALGKVMVNVTEFENVLTAF